MSLSKTIIAMISFLILFAISGMEAEAQDCPPGTSPHILMTPEYPGCSSLGVEFCAKCSPTSGDMEITIIRVIGACDGGVLASYVDYLVGRIIPNYAEICTGAWSPCPNKINLVVYKPLCFYESDQEPNDFLYCNASYCKETWKVCTDNQGEVQRNLVSSEVIGTLGCSELTWEDDPEPGICFRIESGCE